MSLHKPKKAEKEGKVGSEQAEATAAPGEAAAVMNSQQNYEKIGVGTLDKESVYSNYDYKQTTKGMAGTARGKTLWTATLVGSGVVLGGVVLICLVLGTIGVARGGGDGTRCVVEEVPAGPFASDGVATSSSVLLTKEVLYM